MPNMNKDDLQKHHDLYHNIFKIRRSRVGLVKPDSLKAFEKPLKDETSSTLGCLC